jgi:hypothetical protein
MPRTNGPDADPDPAIFVMSFTAYYFLNVLLHNFSKMKSPKEVTKQ